MTHFTKNFLLFFLSIFLPFPSVLSPVDNACVSTCSDGNYADREEQSCMRCFPSCLTCDGPFSTDCLTCPEDLTMNHGSCESGCSVRTYVNDSEYYQKSYCSYKAYLPAVLCVTRCLTRARIDGTHARFSNCACKNNPLRSFISHFSPQS